ncbi:MAG: NnrS family protein [Nitrospirales bacterium]
MAEAAIDKPSYHGPAFFSYGFRPFFLGAAIFSGVEVPAWILLFVGGGDPAFLYAPRDWHVHEMLFGFLPAVITGFLLTAIPNWTERAPVRGMPLMLVWTLWLAGRLVIAMPWFTPLVSAIVDGAFLVVVAAIVWREIAASGSWSLGPMGGLISLYAGANILFHALALRGAATDLPERTALALVMVLLALIGGRVTPNLTRNFMVQEGMTKHPAPFSYFDGVSVVLVSVAAVAWTVQPQTMAIGWTLMAAGLTNLARLLRWRGWVIWREPLVLILHLGYGWLVMSLLALGGSILGLGMNSANAVHVLTAGAVGVMTLAVMTRASLGHTGRPLHASSMTVVIYILINLGAMLRVSVPSADSPTNIMLGLSAVAWSGAYLLFAVVYGPLLIRPSTDE